jgi:hypothetical protein
MELSAITDTNCTDPCCTTPRRTTSELCERGLRQNRREPLALSGPRVSDDNGLVAQFSLQCRGGLITAIRFKASTCATLLAYCELVAELASGRGFGELATLTPQLLVAELPDVPTIKRDRAVLAVTAFRSALAHAMSAGNVRDIAEPQLEASDQRS